MRALPVLHAQELHRRLGEHVEEDELDAALKATGADGDTVDFPTFMRLWQGSFAVFYEDSVESEALEKKRQRYQARFQMLKARVANPEVGRITTRPSGTPGTLGYRVHFFYRNSDGTEKQISPWHDIPLRNPDKSYNFICEIPKWTRAKFEIATDEPFNPIKQDTRNGVLRDYKWVSLAVVRLLLPVMNCRHFPVCSPPQPPLRSLCVPPCPSQG